MELSSSKIKKFLIFLETELSCPKIKRVLIFSQKKLLFYFMKQGMFLKKLLIFQKRNSEPEK